MCDEKYSETVFFRRFLGYVFCQWTHFNSPHINLTLIFFKSIFRQVGHLERSHFKADRGRDDVLDFILNYI